MDQTAEEKIREDFRKMREAVRYKLNSITDEEMLAMLPDRDFESLESKRAYFTGVIDGSNLLAKIMRTALKELLS